jgi:hypothetical protein
MKAYAYSPKTVAQARAAMEIAKACGRFDNIGAWNPNDLSHVVGMFLEFSSNGCILWGATTSSEQLCSLDDLVAALSAPPSKQPKELLARYITGNLPVTECRVLLDADGSIQFGCHEIPKETAERIVKEYTAYHKETP